MPKGQPTKALVAHEIYFFSCHLLLILMLLFYSISFTNSHLKYARQDNKSNHIYSSNYSIPLIFMFLTLNIHFIPNKGN